MAMLSVKTLLMLLLILVKDLDDISQLTPL